MRSQTFQRAALTKAADEIGIPGFHPHELRHTAASLAIASGADVEVVQQMLGHKSATMTLDLYGHSLGDRLDIVADAMDAARTSALAEVYPVDTRGELVELRKDTKYRLTRYFPGSPDEIRTRATALRGRFWAQW
jgi:hypothetical protein